MSTLSAKVTGSLTVAPPTTATVESNGSSGCSYGLSLRDENAAPVNEISQQRVVATSGSFVALPFPTNLRGRVLYIRMKTPTAGMSVRITQETAGVTTIANVRGMLFLEVDEADRITLVEVDGDATFEWACFGDNA